MSEPVNRDLKAEETALILVDIQSEYWSANKAIPKDDFPKFEENVT